MKKTILFLFVLSFFVKSFSQDKRTFENPILSGFYPDPSICRVNDDYFMIHSSFEYFPGIPIFQSKDLVNWKQIGNVLNRPSQLSLVDGLEPSRGIFAPTIRHHNDTFYIVVTSVSALENFYVTATDPAGPWSEPIQVKAPGIDPTLFWDDDGQSYFIGAYNLHGYREWEGQNGAYIQKINIKTGELIDTPVQMTFGHATNAVWGESPHIYKIDGRYMLMIAEGGTSVHHAVTVFESDSLMGKYTPSLINPVLTHRHLGKDYPIQSVGHCDIVQTPNGEWWGVLLATRPVDGHVLLGRETFLVPLTFEDRWPVFNVGKGLVEFEGDAPNLKEHTYAKHPSRYDFEADTLGFEWYMLRTPKDKWYEITNGSLVMQTRPHKLTELKNPSFLGKKIEHMVFKSYAELTFKTKAENEEAGFVVQLDNKNYYSITLSAGYIALRKVHKGVETLIAKEKYSKTSVVLGLEANTLDYQFYFGENSNSLNKIGPVQSAKVVGPATGLDFTGPVVGMYTSSNGKQSSAKAIFNWFDYIPIKK